MEQTSVRELQDVVIRFSGDSGDGMQRIYYFVGIFDGSVAHTVAAMKQIKGAR